MPATAEAAPIAPIRIGLFGDFRISNGDAVIRPRGRKARAILAYLAVAPTRTVSRERVADLLWSDRGAEQARGSLRQMLAELRAIRGVGEALAITRDAISYVPNAVISDVDIVLDAAGRQDAAVLASTLAGAGDCFLADMSEVSPAFDDWLAVERVRQHERVVVAVAAATAAMIGREAPMQIQEILRALDRIDPWNEAIARLGFEADHAAGDVASLHRRYRRLCDGLAEDLGVDPSPETKALFERLAANGTSVRTTAVVAELAAPAMVAPTILISPIEAITGDPQALEIAAILTDDIRTTLAPYREVRIVALEATTAGDVEQSFAGALVAYVLSGKVRQIGSDIRVNLLLGNVGSGTVIWSDQLSVGRDDLAAAIDRVVAKTVGSVLPAIELDVAAMPEVAGYSGDDDVVCYAKARRLIAVDRTLDEVRAGAAMLEDLVARTPRHVQATTWLARMYNTDYWQKIAGHDVAYFRARALELARRAVAIEPGDGRLLLRLSWCHLRSRHWDRAERGFRQATAQMPHHADSLNECAFGFCLLGDLGIAEPLMQRAFALNPFAPAHYHADYAILLMLKSDFQAAEEHFEVCGEGGLLYLAARLANAARLPMLPVAELNDLVATFTAEFGAAWQPDRPATIADIRAWADNTLPFRQPEHAALLTEGLVTALETAWQGGRGTTG